MGARSDQFLRLPHGYHLRSVSSPTIYRAPLRSVSSPTIGGPLRSFFYLLYGGSTHVIFLLNIWGPLIQLGKLVFCLLYMGPLRSFSSFTVWATQVCFFAYYMGAPQISFFAYRSPSDLFLCIWGPHRSVALLTIYGAPFQVSFFAHYMGAPQISFFAYYMYGAPSTCFFAYDMGAPSDQFLCLLYGSYPPQVSFLAYHAYIPPPPRSVFSLTTWGLPQITFFAYYMEAPSDLFLCILYGGPLRSVFSLTI